jgi:hypothetical protein
MRRLVGILLAGAFGLGCKVPAPLMQSPYSVIRGDPVRPTSVPDVSQAEWTLARERLASMRSVLPQKPYVERVQVGVVDPRSGKVFRGRGAVAVSPNRAARLVLLGPGGTTALDLWVTRDRFRFSVPALDLDRRGGSDPAESAGLPIGFLRWWFLAPLGGELVLARSNAAEAAFILRDGPGTVMIRTDGAHFVALRREGSRLEAIEWSGPGLVPHAGAHGHYVDGALGTRISIQVEEVLPDEPDPAAFEEPSETGRSL